MTDTQLSALLTEYAQDSSRTLEDVAIKCQISVPHARRLMKKFAYAMSATMEDPDYPSRAAARMGVSNDIAQALEDKIDEYADLHMLNQLIRGTRRENRGSPMHMADRAIDAEERQESGISASSLSGSRPTRIMRWILSDLMHGKVEKHRATSFLELFDMEQDYFMMNPVKLEIKMKEHFGNKEGQVAFNQFCDMVQSRLGPSQQFGGAAWQAGAPTGGMGASYGTQTGFQPQQAVYTPSNPRYMGGNSFLSFYQAKGVIPQNVDPESPEARKAIEEYEADKKERRQSDEIANKMRNLLNLRMVEMVDPKNMAAGGSIAGGGGVSMDQQMLPYVMGGMSERHEVTHPDGRREVFYSPRQANGGGTTDPTQQLATMIDAFSKIAGMMNGGQNGVNGILGPVLGELVKKGAGLDGNSNGPNAWIAQIEATKKLMETINPMSNFQNNVEMMRLSLAEKRIDNDAKMAEKTLDVTRSREADDKNWEREQERMSAGRVNSLIDTLSKDGFKAVQPLIEAFVATKLGPKMGGMMGGGAGMPPPGGMPPGMGGEGQMMPESEMVNDIDVAQTYGTTPIPPEQRKMPGIEPSQQELMAYMNRAKPNFDPSTMHGAGGPAYAMRTELEREAEIEQARAAELERRRAQRAEQDRMQAWADMAAAQQQMQQEGPRKYSAQEFMQMTPEQLQTYKAQAKDLLESARSLDDALRNAEYERNLMEKRMGITRTSPTSPPVTNEVDTTHQPQLEQIPEDSSQSTAIQPSQQYNYQPGEPIPTTAEPVRGEDTGSPTGDEVSLEEMTDEEANAQSLEDAAEEAGPGEFKEGDYDMVSESDVD